jgi:cytochrome c oxidase cbb3-type subunit 3
MRKLFLSLGLYGAGTVLLAQVTTPAATTAVEMASKEQINTALNLAFATIGVLLFVVIILAVSIQSLIQVTLHPEGAPASEPNASWWDRFKGVAPAPGQIMDRDIGHEYDGITELDNDMPPWFKFLFYTTILFAVVYLMNYHVFKWTPLQAEEYAQEMQVAETELSVIREKQAMNLNEDIVTALTDASGISAGKTIFEQNCSVCHGKEGEGLVGPNLTDEFWIHGGGIKNVFKIVKVGVPDKGMIAWQDQLNPLQIQQVSSYVLTLQGTNPTGAKAAQGEKWSEGSTTGSIVLAVDSIAVTIDSTQ